MRASVQQGRTRLEKRQYKNDIVCSTTKLILKLSLFFTNLYGGWKSAPVSKLIWLSTKRGRSYFFFALRRLRTESNIMIHFMLYHHWVAFRSNVNAIQQRSRLISIESFLYRQWSFQFHWNTSCSIWNKSLFRTLYFPFEL